MIRLQEKFVSASIIIFVHAPIILLLTNSQKKELLVRLGTVVPRFLIRNNLVTLPVSWEVN